MSRIDDILKETADQMIERLERQLAIAREALTAIPGLKYPKAKDERAIRALREMEQVR